jgi:hypothetical protein
MDYAKMRTRAQRLRAAGLSYKFIAKKLHLSVSSAYLYTKAVPLTKRSKQKLLNAADRARAKGREKRLDNLLKSYVLLKISAEKSVVPILRKSSNETWKFICSLLYWCEGSKPQAMSQLTFTNSDPALMAFYLHSLRKAFVLDETKFRVQLHLHEYHDANKQTRFWSKITSIPISQFNRPYLKPHTGNRQRTNYPGCASIRYHDAKIAKFIKYTYTATAQQFLGKW